MQLGVRERRPPTVAGDMEMAPDQPRFMDETVVVESKAVAIRARRATVHQRGSAPRHDVAATRSRLRGWSQAEGESVGRLIGTLARMHGQGKVGRPFAVFKPFKPERLFKWRKTAA